MKYNWITKYAFEGAGSITGNPVIPVVQNEAYATAMELKENLAYGTVVSGDTQATMDLKENPAYGTAALVSGDTQAPCSMSVHMTTTSNDSDYEN